MKHYSSKRSIAKKLTHLLFMSLLFFAVSCNRDNGVSKLDPADIPVFGTMNAELTSPPHVPPSTANRKATHLIVDMEILELEGEMTNGVTYTYWTFGGSVPGSFIRAKLGDEIEFHLKNHPNNKLPHNIDLHAVNGPGGGAVSSFVAPGHETVFTFKTLHPGLYVYHCATAPVGMHIGNGMYGLILVEPTEGLPKVDHEFYVMQGDFYTKGSYGKLGHQDFDMQKAIDENPDYVVFNGRVGAMVGKDALQAKPGETIRLFVGNGGPNLISSFHVIGEIFDKVQINGGDMVNHNVQTQEIPAGSASIFEFKVDAPGEYVLVDHSIFRAFNKGALAQLEVVGEKNEAIYKGKIQEGIYQPEGGRIQSIPTVGIPDKKAKNIVELTYEEKMKKGKILYNETCIACHQMNGQGVGHAFPPLAKSDYLNANLERAISIVMHGKTGEIVVNGQKFNNTMPAQDLEDKEIASILTYVYNSWGNSGKDVTIKQVNDVRVGKK